MTGRCGVAVLGIWWLLSGCDSNPGPGPETHDTKYTAIGVNGEWMDPGAEAWPCVLDRITELTWEVKSAEPGLHYWQNTYSWYQPAESHEGDLDYRGVPAGGGCAGSDCDTWAYVQAVNAAGYCGHDDWRLPTRDELASISDGRRIESPPTTNLRFFPHAQAAEYWSANDYHFQFNTAWVWNYRYGHDRVEFKATPRLVRLVRGEAAQLARIKD